MNSKVCGICYKAILSSDGAACEDTILELLDIVFISEKVNEFKKLTVPAVCDICLENIHEMFDFKSKCVYIEDLLTPYIETSNSSLDLKEIGIKENLFPEQNLSNIEVVCRLCFNAITEEKINLHSAIKENKLEHIFEKNLTEVNVQLVEESYVCNTCLTCLKKYSDLITISSHPNKQKQIPEVSSKKSSGDKKKKTEDRIESKSDCDTESESSSESDEEDDLFRCHKCSFQSKYQRSLQHHLKTVHSNVKLKCPKCPQELKKGSMKRHMESVHFVGGQWYYCDKCSHKNRTKDGLRVHSNIHKDEKEIKWHHCKECSYKSRAKGKLTRHLLLHREKSPKHKCTICDYSTHYKENLKKHMPTHDENAEMFSCDQCDYKTKHKGYLKYHKAVHAEPGKVKTYKCKKCSYETIHKGNLMKQHMKVHPEVQLESYKCDKCDFKTLYKAHFKNHEKRHMTLDDSEYFKCDTCSFKTRHKASIQRHVQLHLEKDSS